MPNSTHKYMAARDDDEDTADDLPSAPPDVSAAHSLAGVAAATRAAVARDSESRRNAHPVAKASGEAVDVPITHTSLRVTTAMPGVRRGRGASAHRSSARLETLSIGATPSATERSSEFDGPEVGQGVAGACSTRAAARRRARYDSKSTDADQSREDSEDADFGESSRVSESSQTPGTARLLRSDSHRKGGRPSGSKNWDRWQPPPSTPEEEMRHWMPKHGYAEYEAIIESVERTVVDFAGTELTSAVALTEDHLWDRVFDYFNRTSYRGRSARVLHDKFRELLKPPVKQVSIDKLDARWAQKLRDLRARARDAEQRLAALLSASQAFPPSRGGQASSSASAQSLQQMYATIAPDGDVDADRRATSATGPACAHEALSSEGKALELRHPVLARVLDVMATSSSRSPVMAMTIAQECEANASVMLEQISKLVANSGLDADGDQRLWTAHAAVEGAITEEQCRYWRHRAEYALQLELVMRRSLHEMRTVFARIISEEDSDENGGRKRPRTDPALGSAAATAFTAAAAVSPATDADAMHGRAAAQQGDQKPGLSEEPVAEQREL